MCVFFFCGLSFLLLYVKIVKIIKPELYSYNFMCVFDIVWFEIFLYISFVVCSLFLLLLFAVFLNNDSVQIFKFFAITLRFFPP